MFIPHAAHTGKWTLQRPVCLCLAKGLGVFPVKVPGRFVFAYVQILEVTLYKTSFLGSIIIFCQISPYPLLISSVHQCLTRQLVTVSLSSYTYTSYP